MPPPTRLHCTLERLQQVLSRTEDVVGTPPDALPQSRCRQRGLRRRLPLEQEEPQLHGEPHVAKVGLAFELGFHVRLMLLECEDGVAMLLAQPRHGWRRGQPSHHRLHAHT